MTETRNDSVNILLVDDRPDKILALESILGDLDVDIVKAQSGREALRALLVQDFAVILLDVNMPGMDGFETASLIRQRKRSEHTPIIFFTAHTDTETHVSRGYSLGAVDYIHTPVVPEVMKTKVSVFVELYRKTEQVRRQSEELRDMEVREHQRRLDDAMERLQAEAKRNLFFVMAIDMLAIAGFDGFFKQLNPAWEKVLGFTDEELKRSLVLDFVHPEDREMTSEKLRELEAGTFIAYFENRFRTRDGSYRWLGWTASPYVAERLVYIFARDITERRTAEEVRGRLLLNEQQRAAQLQKLTAASLDINSASSIEAMLRVIADQAREIIGANQAVTRIVGDGGAGIVGNSIAMSPESAPLLRTHSAPIGAALHTRAIEINRPLRLTAAELEAHPILGSLVARLDPQIRPTTWLSAPLTGRDGRNMGIIQLSGRGGEDFSEEDEIVLVQLAQIASISIENTLFREAREANRLKDEFLAMLSHELRTPLNAMLGWTRLLRTGKLDSASVERALEIVERNVKAQAQLIEDLLDVSRIITGKIRLDMQLVELGPVVEAAIDALRPAADAKEIRIEARLDGNDWASGDASRLQQIVWNLLSNAIKFTPKGGSIEATLSRATGQAELMINDSGEGIHPELLPYIFDRFRQGDTTSARSHGGLGLGLAIVRHLVELHGGAVRAESRGKGYGSTFIVRLPLVESFVETPAPAATVLGVKAAPEQGLTELEKVRVLVVEDDADTRDLIETALRGRGAEVLSAWSVDSALETLERERVDVLLSDIAMPGQDGYALITKLRARGPEHGGGTAAIALTAYAGSEDRARALSAGFQMHVSKPIELGALIRAISTLARTSSERDHEASRT